MHTLTLRPPYLIFIGDEARGSYAKTGIGLAHWRPELCAGQCRLTPDAFDMGLPDMSVTEAAAAGINSLIVGTALIGGSIPDSWLPTLLQAARCGMDVVAGLHTRLVAIPALVTAAAAGKGRLIDVRTPPATLPIGTGEKRPGMRLLTVGTDCALGKKYTALQLERDMRRRGMGVDFRASGQTGIMIAGSGIPIDAVVADFLVGAAEALSPANDPAHWDVIEGQGGIFHPAYAPVSHGLLLGSQPDAFVVCHAAGREQISGWDNFPLPSIAAVIERTLQIGALTNARIRCVGISVNTSALAPGERGAYLAALGERYRLPCVDPLVDGTDTLVDALPTP